MNLAFRDIRHNRGRFLLTCVGLSLLLGIVMSMIGIYRGLVAEALTVARAPAVVFLRDGEYLGSLNGIRDWQEYRDEVARLAAGPARPRPIAIPVRGAGQPGACA